MEVLVPKPDAWYIENPHRGTITMAKILGPFHDSGDPWQRLTISTDHLNRFDQGHRLFTETSVSHRKVDGQIRVLPALAGAIPTSETEDRTGATLYDIDLYDYSGKKHKYRTSLDFMLQGSVAYGYHDPWLDRFGVYHVSTPNRITTCIASLSNYYADKPKGLWSWRNTRFEIVRTRPQYCEYRLGNLIGPSWPYTGMEPTELPHGIVLARRLIDFKSDYPGDPAVHTARKLYMKETSLSMSKVRTWVSRFLHPELFAELPSLNLSDWGDLTHEATKNLDALSANMIAFVLDLKNIKSLIPKLKELNKVKTHADNYLSYKYGILPTIDDLKSIWEAFSPTKYYDRSGLRRVSAYDEDSSLFSVAGYQAPIHKTRRIHLAVNENDTGLDALVEKARNIGVFPSLTNIWDLIPYSFVLDWFIDVGSVLERIDTRHRLLNLDIPFVVKSEKIEYQFGLSDLSIGIGASIQVSDYSREVTKVIPQPRIFGEIDKPPSVQNHWIEGSALIIQRTKN